MPSAALGPHSGGPSVARRAVWLVPLGVASYGLRFASSRLVLTWAGDRRFDPHGFAPSMEKSFSTMVVVAGS